MITRRIASGLLGMAPLSARNLFQGVAENAAPTSWPAPTSWSDAPPQQPAGPVMQQHEVMRLALKVPEMRQMLYDCAWRNNRHVGEIDADIDVYRSFSLAAKIAFQRQRNVERYVQQHTRDPYGDGFAEPLRNFIHKLMWGR